MAIASTWQPVQALRKLLIQVTPAGDPPFLWNCRVKLFRTFVRSNLYLRDGRCNKLHFASVGFHVLTPRSDSLSHGEISLTFQIGLCRPV